MSLKTKLFRRNREPSQVSNTPPEKREYGPSTDVVTEAPISKGLSYVADRLQTEDIRSAYLSVMKESDDNPSDPQAYETAIGMSRLIPTDEFGSTELGITRRMLFDEIPDDEIPAITQAAQEVAARLAPLYADVARFKKEFRAEHGVSPLSDEGDLILQELGINYRDIDKTDTIYLEIEAKKQREKELRSQPDYSI